MTQDAETLIEQAFHHEQKGDHDTAIRLYKQVADGDSEHATYARKSAERLQEMRAMAARSPLAGQPDGQKVVVGLLGIVVVFAVGLSICVPSLRTTLFGALLDFSIYFLMCAAVGACFKKRGTPLPALKIIVVATIFTLGGIYMRSNDPHAPAGGKEFLEEVFR